MPADSCRYSNAQHLVVAVLQNDKAIGGRLLNLANAGVGRVLMKELALRAVVGHPHLAGEGWRLALRILDGSGDDASSLELAAFPEIRDGTGAPLAVLSVALSSLSWIGEAIARRLNLEEPYSFQVGLVEPDDPTLEAWLVEQEENNDFVITAAPRELRLPGGFFSDSPGPRRTIRRKDSWLRCVLRNEVYAEFMDAAATEKQAERAWVGTSSIHLADGVIYVLVDRLAEAPAQRQRYSLRTLGRDFYALRQRLGDRLNAFLHLHPSDINGVSATTQPSEADAEVAWNLEATTWLPVVLPIALFGCDPDDPGDGVAAYSFLGGVLTEVDLEVL
ncbi:MAG: hypothetical protein JXB46_03765 [Candidatus Eisenbacteria bacterium]|nr:hypothetical protein [Candidatus Eisenbacteria bacterium]